MPVMQILSNILQFKKIQYGGSKLQNLICLAWISVSWGFPGRWFRIRSQTLKIQNAQTNVEE